MIQNIPTKNRSISTPPKQIKLHADNPVYQPIVYHLPPPARYRVGLLLMVSNTEYHSHNLPLLGTRYQGKSMFDLR